MQQSKTTNGVQRAIAAVGGQVKVGEKLGVTQQAVSSWVRRGFVPLMRADELAQISGVPARELMNPRVVRMVEPKAQR